MKTFWIVLVFLAVPGFRPALAYEDLFPRQPGPDKNQSKQPGLQGKEDSRTRQRGQQRGQANSQTRPWEVRPWDQGRKIVRRSHGRRGHGTRSRKLRRIDVGWGEKLARSSLRRKIGRFKRLIPRIPRLARGNVRAGGRGIKWTANGTAPHP